MICSFGSQRFNSSFESVNGLSFLFQELMELFKGDALVNIFVPFVHFFLPTIFEVNFQEFSIGFHHVFEFSFFKASIIVSVHATEQGSKKFTSGDISISININTIEHFFDIRPKLLISDVYLMLFTVVLGNVEHFSLIQSLVFTAFTDKSS